MERLRTILNEIQDRHDKETGEHTPIVLTVAILSELISQSLELPYKLSEEDL